MCRKHRTWYVNVLLIRLGFALLGNIPKSLQLKSFRSMSFFKISLEKQCQNALHMGGRAAELLLNLQILKACNFVPILLTETNSTSLERSNLFLKNTSNPEDW